jgi:hypothetical protein
MDNRTPKHYGDKGIDVIDFSLHQFSKEEVKGFIRINAIKYLTRYDKKGGLGDLKKAFHYLEMLIDLEGATPNEDR